MYFFEKKYSFYMPYVNNRDLSYLFFYPSFYVPGYFSILRGVGYDEWEKVFFFIQKKYFDKYTVEHKTVHVSFCTLAYNHILNLLSLSKTRVDFHLFILKVLTNDFVGFKTAWEIISFYRKTKVIVFYPFFFLKNYNFLEYNMIGYILYKSTLFELLNNIYYFIKPGVTTLAYNSNKSFLDLFYLIILFFFWKLMASFLTVFFFIFTLKILNILNRCTFAFGSSRLWVGVRELKIFFILFILNTAYTLFRSFHYFTIDFKCYVLYTFFLYSMFFFWLYFIIIFSYFIYRAFAHFFFKKTIIKIINDSLILKFHIYFWVLRSLYGHIMCVFWLLLSSFGCVDIYELIPGRPWDPGIKPDIRIAMWAVQNTFYALCGWHAFNSLIIAHFFFFYFFVFTVMHWLLPISISLRLNLYGCFLHKDEDISILIYDWKSYYPAYKDMFDY